MPNKIATNFAKLNRLPQPARSKAVSLAVGRFVPFVGTAGLRLDEMTPERVVATIRNRRKVQNHIHGVHAAAMTLLAETVTGLVVGMNLPDDKLPLIKSLTVNFVQRSQGDMRAEAALTGEQIQQMNDEEKGNFPVAVTVTDESGESPIECEMIWAWVPKKR